MLTFSGSVIYTMSADNPPAWRVRLGETFAVETLDCFGNADLRNPVDVNAPDFPGFNPATGPIYIEGAMPGDTLRMEILDVEVASLGSTEIGPGFGALADRIPRDAGKQLAVENGKIRFHEGITLESRPMIGVIGVAPAGGAVPTNTPGDHGGNMDCTMIGKGATLCLPVAAKGALLSLGDLHACMGDGEIGGCGLEIPGKVTLRVEVVKGEGHYFPMLYTQREVAVLASAGTLDEAARMATSRMHDLLIRDMGLSSDEAVMLQSLAANLVICQVVNPLVTVRMVLPLAGPLEKLLSGQTTA